jgi:hypothetical protein
MSNESEILFDEQENEKSVAGQSFSGSLKSLKIVNLTYLLSISKIE